MAIKKTYIVYAVIILVAVSGIALREYMQKRHVAQLNERIEQLTETANTQSAKIDEMTARLRAAQAELDSANRYGENLETILGQSEGVRHEIMEKVSANGDSRDWYQSPVPAELCTILHERLCDRPCGGDED